MEKGTTQGVCPDFDGDFSLPVADENTIVVISYLGFKTQEIASQGKTELNIILEEGGA